MPYKDKEKYLAYQKKFKEERRETLLEVKKAWRDSNKDKIKQKEKEYRDNNKDKLKEYITNRKLLLLCQQSQVSPK